MLTNFMKYFFEMVSCLSHGMTVAMNMCSLFKEW